MTHDEVIARLSVIAADAYINELELAKRWPSVVKAVVQAIAARTGQPVDQILAVLAAPPLTDATGNALSVMGGPPA